ncbi:MAG: N-6 DNA methylase [Chloroflexota bacterium]
MPYTFAQSQDEIARLVAHFRMNRASFLAPTFKEAQARMELINPLFDALNWDVHNRANRAPDYTHVLVEEAQPVRGAQRSPDYTFRVSKHDRKFFVEAKRPGVALKTDAASAIQLRLYGWNANLPLSILTDFEELAIYDCRPKPKANDKPTVARLDFYTFEEYPDRWQEIWDRFSLDAVLGGAFDQYAETSKTKRGALTVDADFLDTIEQWRKSLAQQIELRNNLSADDLTDAVQRTIDRLIFMRIAEDRDIEPYEQLKAIADGDDIYKRLIKLFKQADAKYNSGLFDFAADKRTPALAMDDKVLRPIIADLYSVYNFRLMPVEILGNVYEQFLGKVIRVTAGGHAKVEEKPAVRKAGGVYYTPSYIVEYIVRHTVGKLVEGKTPAEVARLRVLDMACGSGSFLLGAYQFLLDWHLQWYSANQNPKLQIQNPKSQLRILSVQSTSKDPISNVNGIPRLTTAERKRILLNNIFGVDIDRQAVEVTKLSLMLKVLEGETQETLQLAFDLGEARERALPNLDQNIQCGNSLIGPDYFGDQLLPDADELKRINPFDWASAFPAVMKAGGFDCVIGNPPYVLLQDEFRDDYQLKYLRKRYDAASYKVDTYHLFIERGIELTALRGRCAMITPANFLANSYLANLRRYMLTHSLIDHILVIDGGVFKGVSVDNAVFVTTKDNSQSKEFPIIHTVPENKVLAETSRNVISTSHALADDNVLLIGQHDQTHDELWNHIQQHSQTLGAIANVNFGKQLRDRKKFQADVIEVTNIRAVPRTHRPCYTGRDSSRYYLAWGNLACLDDNVARRGGCWDSAMHNAKNKILTRQIGEYPEFSIDYAGYH